MKTAKPKKCRACTKLFVPFSSLAKACSVTCSLTIIREENRKAYDRETRQRKQAIKGRSEWLKDCQAMFNKFIRTRDNDMPCISCLRHHTGQYHAGHYKSVGANPELRFDEDNCHKQCAPCNNHLSGNISNYRPNLVIKVGQGAVDRLEGPQTAKKYTVDDLKKLKRFYNSRIKQLNEGE